MTAQAPILLFGSYGELDVYASVIDAERAIDPWTLADGALSAADASGRVLRVLPIGHSVCLTDTGAIVLAVGLVVSLIGAVMGGTLGARWHRRVDRHAVETA